MPYEYSTVSSDNDHFEFGVLADGGRVHSLSFTFGDIFWDGDWFIKYELYPALKAWKNRTMNEDQVEIIKSLSCTDSFVEEILEAMEMVEKLGWLDYINE